MEVIQRQARRRVNGNRNRGKRDRNRPPPFKVDQLLQIDAGPFTSFQGLYVEGEGDRLKLWVDIFGRQVLHEISEALVRPV